MNYTITPLPMGFLEVSTSVLQRLRGFYDRIQSSCIVWLVQGDNKTILVDAGPSSIEWSEKYHRVMSRTPEQHIVPALAEHGLTLKDVDAVILTHLHWDHVHGLKDIPDVPIYVQQKEVEYALNPLPCDARAYEADLDSQPFQKHMDRFIQLVGDHEIMPGIRVMLTPGHTPGSQAILIDTERGVHALMGDTVNLYSSLDFDPPWPPGIFQNLHDFYSSVERVQKVADVLLPNHDLRVLGKQFPE